MSRLLALALALYGVQAGPLMKRGTVPDDENCIASIPPGPDPAVVNAIYLAGVAQNVNMAVMQATYETCMQETRCNNISCGDQDSVGVFQQRPSMGWGSVEQIMDVTYSTNQFLAQAIPFSANNPGASPDGIAQGVQRAEAGNLYAQHIETANQLIQQAAAATGVSWGGISGGSGGGSAPAPAPPPPSGGGGSGCSSTYTPVPGDYCWLIANNNGISVESFLAKNPSIDSGCSNLQVGVAYCL
ncbi:hypothetical protein AURDEDRAFT_117414 [Auricularia subglabra TFB-10046 SS5]|uniref:LysM domain-containing protein n=1 Tax=Auricularia subglabra (strain TFB-10046 / SS5) TaxID=717982 RepID=J0LEL7_AURST|nr:hypothetical protein AURDEDRAFT_117414 [Auricularia subglabra TFB-10046 SS5]